jgi:hypothetical protein
MTSYPSTQRSTIFRNCLDALQKHSPEAAVFLFGHKIAVDLDARGDGAPLLERRARELQAESGSAPVTVFGTSIRDETLL